MYHSLLLGKAILSVSLVTGKSGSTWPGHVALKAEPHLINKVMLKNPGIKVILIAGTNGKTTTTKALTHILESQKTSVLTNVAGANLLNGLASLLVKHISLTGALSHKAILFEVDENTLPLVLQEIPNPSAIILLNLFRDQLDRYGEVNIIADKWKGYMEKLGPNTVVVANADDPLIAHTASFSKTHYYFSVNDIFKNEKKLSHAVDSTTCPRCRSPLIYSKISYSHLGTYACSKCEFTSPKGESYTFESNLLGTYNIYNLSSAILTLDKVFGITPYASFESLKNFKPAFGRQELIEVENRKAMLLLSKNPTGFNESLKVALSIKNSTLLIILNDRIPDGRDISWIWDVDFEILKNLNIKIIVSGDRAYDLANRLYFANVKNYVYENYHTAYQEAIKSTEIGKTLTILPTYSAMLEIRKLISGRSIL